MIESKSTAVVAVEDCRDTVDSTDSRRDTGWCESLLTDVARRGVETDGSGKGTGSSAASTNSSFSSDDSSSSGIAWGDGAIWAGLAAGNGTTGVEFSAGAYSLFMWGSESWDPVRRWLKEKERKKLSTEP
ncbi:hypothetical protein OGATHE_006149 [Ogataea polymorpha]|uniref:Uncharacterized protein n=1 Tax=Ogataea polymorpha TaxID=460523 RepID=A0A9P8NT48_9ASCO|nr:hypothetical protein OGATHE_006149 [Ogataea polymorpha]